MGSVITEAIIEMPDVHGLPVHRVTTSFATCVGDEVHIIKGQNVCGTIQWTYVEIWKLEEVLRAANAAYQIAKVSIGETRLREIYNAH